MRQYIIVYKQLPQYTYPTLYLSRLSPPSFSYNPKDAYIFDFVSEASMLFELEEYKSVDKDHANGCVAERIETITFKEINT